MSLTRALSIVALVFVPSFAACAGPRVGPVREVTEQAGRLLASAPAMYGPDASKVPETPADARLRATFENGIPAAAKPMMRHEPALDLVARVAADMLSGEKQPPSQAMMEWLFWRAGATSRYARMEMMVAEGVDDLDLQTVTAAGHAQAPVYPEAFGIARSSRGRAAQVIVIGRRLVDVDPLPKAHAPGASITVKVRPTDAFGELSLLADDENGGVAEARFTPAEAGAFTVTYKAPSKPGRYFLEVTGLDARTNASTPENPWRRTLFLAPIYVGVPESQAPDEFMRAPAPPATTVDAAAWSAKILEQYNAVRTKAGKKPAATDGRLTALAQERSGVAARAAREPGPDVVLADKLAAAGAPPHDYDAMEARLDSAADYAGLRLLVPSVRRRIVGAEQLLVGIGLTPRAANARGESEQAIVEYAVEPVARQDPAKDRPKVYEALDALAKGDGRAPYKHDEDVAKAVQQFANDVCRGQVRPNQMKLLVDKARGVGDKFKQWNTAVWRAGYDYTRWQETSVLAKAKEPPLAFAEVGLCQGDLPGKPGGSYVVVLQFAP
ncbi:Hypothetical protein A7982_00538 [Minicystis rosea]|nr:Hypothetical protein A7982_00538 [Minicystis rosea]